jgi:CBS domain-containing protein
MRLAMSTSRTVLVAQEEEINKGGRAMVVLEETVGRWMRPPALAVEPNAALADAYALMVRHGVRHIPVVEGGRIVGVLSVKDLERTAPLYGWERAGMVDTLFRMPVSQALGREHLETRVGRGATLAEAASAMLDAHVCAVPVVEGDRLVGVISAHDILRAVLDRRR